MVSPAFNSSEASITRMPPSTLRRISRDKSTPIVPFHASAVKAIRCAGSGDAGREGNFNVLCFPVQLVNSAATGVCAGAVTDAGALVNPQRALELASPVGEGCRAVRVAGHVLPARRAGSSRHDHGTLALTGDEQLQREGHDDGEAARQRQEEQRARLHRSGRVAALSSVAMTTTLGRRATDRAAGGGRPGLRRAAPGHAGGRGRATGSSASTSTPTGSSASRPASRPSRTSATSGCGPRSTPAATCPTADPGRAAPASTSRSSRCRRRCSDGSPDLSYIEAAARDAGRPPARRRHRRARVDDLPGHHRGAGAADPRGRLGPGRRHRLPPRLQPRAHRPRQPDVDASRTRPRSCRASTTPSLAAVQAFYDRLVEHDRAGRRRRARPS